MRGVSKDGRGHGACGHPRLAKHAMLTIASAPQDDGGVLLAYFDPNALKVMMVWVSWMPGITWTFSLTKWPMSVSLST